MKQVFTVESGNQKIRAEATSPIEAAAMLILRPFGQLISIREKGVKRNDDDEIFVDTRNAMAAAIRILNDQPADGRPARVPR